MNITHRMDFSGIYNSYEEIELQDKYDQKKCVICLQEFEKSPKELARNLDSNRVTRIACGHILHTQCLANYLMIKASEINTCSICKGKYEINAKILPMELLQKVNESRIQRNSQIQAVDRDERKRKVFAHAALVLFVITFYGKILLNFPHSYIKDENIKYYENLFTMFLAYSGLYFMIRARHG